MKPIVAAVLALCALGAGQVYDGLVIYNPVYSQTVSLIDTGGQTVNSWRCASTPGYTVYLMPDSTIWRPGAYSRAVMRGGVFGGLIEQYDWDGNVVRSFLWSDSNHQQHHDIHPMPNGNILLLAWARKTRAEAQAMGRVSITGEMWPEEIIEYDPDADSAVWEWRAWDHLIQDVDSTKPNYGAVRDHPELLDINLGTLFMYGDWIHANIVEYHERRDEIVFSSHFLNELYVIDHSTTTEEARGRTGGRHGKGGDIIYRWGNPQNYGRGTPDDQHFFVVHGANWIPGGFIGAGNILVFNNGDRPGSQNDYSSVEEITPPLDSLDHYRRHPDSAFGPAAPGWTYEAPGFYSGHMSGAYRLANGNTFITEAVSGRLSEVNYDKQVVWQRQTSAWNGRAIKYPRDFTGVGENGEVRMTNDELGMRAGPNPFRNSARVRWTLGGAARVELAVFDCAGRKTAVPARGRFEAGSHEARFGEESLAAGVYLARLTVDSGSGPRVETRVLVKE
ncbi:aryl-sulfate sulfotransferase [candidate division WOR-3 bacterium]|nr:aryl-sulfate sulfotransferase [candidate division WOR-3 bacterium]